jgi:hypothetical protein
LADVASSTVQIVPHLVTEFVNISKLLRARFATVIHAGVELLQNPFALDDLERKVRRIIDGDAGRTP